MVQHAHAQFVPLHVQNAPAICIMVPPGIGVADRDIERPAICSLMGSDGFDHAGIGQGGPCKTGKGKTEAHEAVLDHRLGELGSSLRVLQQHLPGP